MVAAAEIESVLLKYHAVKQAVAVGMADPLVSPMHQSPTQERARTTDSINGLCMPFSELAHIIIIQP